MASLAPEASVQPGVSYRFVLLSADSESAQRAAEWGTAGGGHEFAGSRNSEAGPGAMRGAGVDHEGGDLRDRDSSGAEPRMKSAVRQH